MQQDGKLEQTIKERATQSFSETGAQLALAYAILRAVEVIDRKFPDQRK